MILVGRKSEFSPPPPIPLPPNSPKNLRATRPGPWEYGFGSPRILVQFSSLPRPHAPWNLESGMCPPPRESAQFPGKNLLHPNPFSYGKMDLTVNGILVNSGELGASRIPGRHDEIEMNTVSPPPPGEASERRQGVCSLQFAPPRRWDLGIWDLGFGIWNLEFGS